MVVNKEVVALYAAAAIWADGFYDETEKDILSEVSQVIEAEKDEFIQMVEKNLENIQNLNADELNSKLLSVSKNISEKEKGIIFEIILEIILADGKLSRNEVSNLLAMSENLGLNEVDAVLLLSDMVNGEDELSIEY